MAAVHYRGLDDLMDALIPLLGRWRPVRRTLKYGYRS
jgi:hypothetical protein